MEMLSYPEAARVLGLALGTLYAMVHQRRIPHVRLGPRLVRFRRNELDAWLADRSVPEREEPAMGGSR
jgi:excisionase family DNA binding protein